MGPELLTIKDSYSMKKLLVFSLVMLLALGVSAQEEEVIGMQYKYGPYVTAGVCDNWFVTVGGGVQVYFGGHDFKKGFWKQAAPAVDVAVGKWFLPTVGARLEWSGIKGKSMGRGLYADGTLPAKGYALQKFNSSILHADFLYNLSNAIGGYRADRFWSFVPYVGFGWAHSWNSKYHNNQIAANTGIIHNLRICCALDATIDMRATALGRRYDLYDNPRAFDYFVTVTAGITYNFCERGFQRANELVVVEDCSQYINEINELKSMVEQANAQRDKYIKQLTAEKKRKPAVKEKPVHIVGNVAVFFAINSAEITEQGMINIGYIAEIIKNTDKKFTLYASADRDTGTPEYNQKLSQRRGEAVFDLLVGKFGINPSQLEIRAVGSSEQMFDGAACNRVVVIEN